jgi:HAD superfamily hydrolase (TIGR01509 family)
MPIKAIYFDLGGVIVRTEDKTPRTQLGAEFGLSRLELEKIVHDWKDESSAARASIGAITEEAHWINVTRALNLPLDERRRIQDQFFAGDKIDWDLINFLREARKTYKVGLISNAWDGLRPWIRNQKLDDAFDHLTISAEVHTVKPRPDIYHYALHALGVKAEESVFVDDFIENIHAANALGIKAVHFLSTEQALAEVKNLLNV